MAGNSMGISFEEFKKLYDESNGFMPGISVNHPLIQESQSFYSALKEGCGLLVKNHPELVTYSLEDEAGHHTL